MGNELKQIVFAAKEVEDANGIKFDPNPSLCSTPNLLKDDGELLRSSVSKRKLLRAGNEDDGELLRSSVLRRKLLHDGNEDDGELLRSSVLRRKLLRDGNEDDGELVRSSVPRRKLLRDDFDVEE